MTPDAIHDTALLTISQWQRETSQQHADRLLPLWQARKHLPPELRLNDNTILNGDYGIRLTNNSSTAFTANINGNQANSAGAGIVIHSGGGDFSANINSNTVSGAGFNGIVFEIQSPATVHVNPLVTPESNIIGFFRPSKLGIINTSTGTVDGTIIINSITLTPPTNF